LTKEQSALLKKAQDSIRGAKLLASDNLNDFAVSRAYYAMFYIAEAFLLGMGLSFSKHSAVISAFGNKFTKTKIIPDKFHRYLIEGQEQRNISDYQSELSLTVSQVTEQINRAEQFLELAFQHLGPLPPDI